MQFDKACKLAKVLCQPDESRWAMGYAKFVRDGVDGQLVATNGKALALIRVRDCEGDVDGQLVPRAAVELAVRGAKTTPAQILTNGETKVVTKDGLTTITDPEEPRRFPDYDQVIPRSAKVMSIEIDPKLLLELAQAIGSPASIAIEIPADSVEKGKLVGPLVVKPIASSGGVPADPDNLGVIMPLSAL